MTEVLDIVWGVATSKSLGNTGVTDPDQDSITLMEGGGINLALQNGQSGWVPSMPTLKNDGVRADSALENGTAILASAYGNAIETLQVYLTGADLRSRSAALAKLHRFMEAARAFQIGTQSQPVYMRWQSDCAPAEQYALIVKIDLSFVDFDLANTTENPQVTLVVEREPFWRALPPMDNPKKYAFTSRGLVPTNSGSPAGTEFNYSHLDLMSSFGGPASYRSLVQSNIRNYDEILTSNVNYIDIPASSIPGDAPALALVNWTNKNSSGSVGVPGVWIARTTRPDYYPGNNNNTATQRARNTFNGGDCTPLGAVIVGTVVLNANGLLSNGSAVNRYVLQVAIPAGAASGFVAQWTRAYGQYQNKYLAFIRAQLTAGVRTEIQLSLNWSNSAVSLNNEATTPVQLKQAAFGLTYLGIVDFNKTQRRMATTSGTGVDATSTYLFQLGITKAAGVVATLLVWDLVLVPFDEALGYVLFSDVNLGANEAAFIDKTGYFGSDDDAGFSYQSSQTHHRQMRGQAISLVPGVNNRLYMLADTIDPQVTTAHECRVDIVPCWYGVRDK